MLYYKVDGEKVLQFRSPSYYMVPDGSLDSIFLYFSFSSGWMRFSSSLFCQITAVEDSELSYNLLLVKNKVGLPNLVPGKYKVSVFGINKDGVKRKTAIPSTLTVVPSFANDSIAVRPTDVDYYGMLFKGMVELSTGVKEQSELVKEYADKVETLYEAIINGDFGDLKDEIVKEVLEEIGSKLGYTKEEIDEMLKEKVNVVDILTEDDVDDICK